MNRTFVPVCLWCVCIWAAAAGGPVCGLEQPAPDAIRVRGKVRAVRGGRLHPKEATISDGSKTYRLVLDEKGRSLTKVMHGQKAEIWGIPSKKNGTLFLRVLGYVDDRMTAGHELWRHMRCSACVVRPATLNSRPPRKLRGAAPVCGRYWGTKERLSAWTRDGQYLWAASDSRVYQIDLDRKKTVRVYGRMEGLPDEPVYSLASDGKCLWIVCRSKLAVLAVGSSGISVVDIPAFEYARSAVSADAVWVITAKGTYRFEPGREPAEGAAAVPGPALPTADRIAKTVNRGIWAPHRQRRTAHFISDPVTAGGKVFVSSYGDIYGYDGSAWKQAGDTAWGLTGHSGRVWFLDSQGLNEMDARTGKKRVHTPPEGKRGGYRNLLIADRCAWISVLPGGSSGAEARGGLCRLDLNTHTWQWLPDINGHSTDRISCLASGGNALWVVTATGRTTTRGADPGMSHVKHKSFVPTGFHLHVLRAGTWDSLQLPIRSLDKRLICGQDGRRAEDEIFPRHITEISAGTRSVFGIIRLLPGRYFGGCWPSVSRLAHRPGAEGGWNAGFYHVPEELGLQGSHPAVLNISYGMIHRASRGRGSEGLEAVGHDNVLGLFTHKDTHWAVTEGCVAWHDESAGAWKKALAAQYRYYWRASAAVQDGNGLYIGSDRGVITRLDLKSGLFEIQAVLNDREITGIAKNANGVLVAESRPAQIGALPVGLPGGINPLVCSAVKLEKGSWVEAGPDDMPEPAKKAAWRFRQWDKRIRWDKSDGNFLIKTGSSKPKIYLKEVFFPQFLCMSDDGRTVWVSTYTGMVRVSLDKPPGAGT